MSVASASCEGFSIDLATPFEDVIEKARIVRHRIGRHARRTDNLIEKLWGMLLAAL